MEIYLARHGTTEWNSTHRIQGRTDIELDKTGIAMAEQSGRYLKEHGIYFDLVFSSPLKRAYITAELLSGSGPDRIVTDERLTELYFGGFEGRNVEEMLADPDCPFRFFKKDPFRYNLEVKDICETLDGMLMRTHDFIHSRIEPVIRSGIASNILICGHGALNRALLMNFAHNSDLHDFWGNGLQPNCGITKISCTCPSSEEVVYHVQDKSLILYDNDIVSKTTALL